MKVKVGDWAFGKVVGISEYGPIVKPHNAEDLVFVKVKEGESLDLGDEVQMEFKSFGVGCYWEAEKNGF